MKDQLRFKSFLLSFLSGGVLLLFFFLATGSLYDLLSLYNYSQTTVYSSDDGTYTTLTASDHTSTETNGPRDPQGRWDGDVTIVQKKKTVPGGTWVVSSTEHVHMEEGMRHGRSITTYPDKPDKEVCYHMGHVINCQQKATHVNNAGTSAFQLLSEGSPWFMNSLAVYGFEDTFVEAYMDTLELLLAAYEFSVVDFSSYYNDLLDSLSLTRYDTVTQANAVLSLIQGFEEMKNAEFRLAVLDVSRMEGGSTYNHMAEKYPGYLRFLALLDISEPDFDEFCHEFDSIMNSYGPLDMEDPFFVDSVDNRIIATLDVIGSEEEESGAKKGAIKKAFNSYVFLQEAVSSDVANAVLFSFFEYYNRGDLIQQALRRAYLIGNGVTLVPTVTTALLSIESATSANLAGYIVDDGGAAVTASGIVWGTSYNPSLDDQVAADGSASGIFSVTLDGLTGSTIYYARTYATNSAGTAYGNCISFTTEGFVIGILEEQQQAPGLEIYPNPASDFLHLRIEWTSYGSAELSVMDLNGRVVNHRALIGLTPGKEEIELDLSHLPAGLYHCLLEADNQKVQSARFMIVR